MTIEKKLEERLKAQGWDDVNVDTGFAPHASVQRFKPVRVGYMREIPHKLTAENAVEIEAYFKEQLTK